MRVRNALLGIGTAAMVTLGTAAAASPAQAATPAPGTAAAPIQYRDPGPECTGQAHNCWEYYSWYWTYSSCHDTGRQQLQNNPGRYDNYNCAGGHGLVVWLWLHRP